MHLGKRLCLVRDMHDAEATHDRVKRRIGERHGLRITFAQVGRRSAAAGLAQHRGREIEPGDIGPGGKKRLGAGTVTTAEIENTRARPCARRADDRADRDVRGSCERRGIVFGR